MALLPIKTAVPQRRYQVGEYTATILGEIECEDGGDYRYILAMVQEGSANPKLYITLEHNSDQDQSGSHRMRIIGHGIDQELGTASEWRELEAFSQAALAVAMQALALTDEHPHRLL